MTKDRLFMLRAGFFNGGAGPFYCGDSVAVEGLLSFYPELREAVDVGYVDAARPRADIVALIGAENQSAPVLVLYPQTELKDPSVPLGRHAETRFIRDPVAIRTYLSAQFGVARAA